MECGKVSEGKTPRIVLTLAECTVFASYPLLVVGC